MVLFDTLIDQINDDLKDCLVPVRDRFRLALSTIFDYAVANPTQGNASTAQSAISATFTGTYADGLVSPGISIDMFTQAFLTRHGVGANANQRWVSVRDFIVARQQFPAKFKEWAEEGAVSSVAEWKLEVMDGTDMTKRGVQSIPSDLVHSITKNEKGFTTAVEYRSASMGWGVRKTYGYSLVDGKYVYDGTVVVEEV